MCIRDRSGIPTISRQGKPPATSTSTETGKPATPDTVAPYTEENNDLTPVGAYCLAICSLWNIIVDIARTVNTS